MRLAAALFALLIGAPALATTWRVGPGQPLASIGAVPWESLAAGDSVLIHARATPYREKWVLNRAGTQALPIVVRGIPDSTGALPVIDGANATTRPTLNFWNENRAVLKIGGSNLPPDGMPQWIVIQDLELRGARAGVGYTGSAGAGTYVANAAAIYLEKGQHITLRGCRLADCGNGLFAAHETSDLHVERCDIFGNGNVGSAFEHNIYTEAFGIVFEFNHLGPPLAGAIGNNLKDRSAGTVVRYNWIEGGNRQLDLVESDAPELYDDPSYRTTFVYGNVLLEREGDGNSQIVHYGGDNGGTAQYRKGTLYFHHNTLVSRRAGNTTLLRLSSDGESADVRDNVLFVTAAGSKLALLDQTGALTATRNWLKTGWVPSHSGGAVMVTDAGQITGGSPGFVDEVANDFELSPFSPSLDQAVPLAAAAAAHAPLWEYVRHRNARPRPSDPPADLGAYELGGALAVGTPGIAEAGLSGWPNPLRGACEIRLATTAAGADRPLEVVDMSGRVVARLAPAAPGRWRWAPPHTLAGGLYFARLGTRAIKLLLVR